MNHQKKAYILAAFAIFFWSTVATAFKLALRYMSPQMLVLLASFFAFSTVLFWMVLRNDLHVFSRIRWSHVLHSALLGFLSPFLYYLILFEAYDLLPAQVAQPLNMVWPIVLVFMSIPLLNQKIRWRSIVALFICFIGVLFISSQGQVLKFQDTNFLGVSLALGSSVIWSLFFIFNLRDHRTEEHKLVLNFFFSTVYIFIWNVLQGTLVWPVWEGWISGVYVGIFEMGLTYLLWLKALRYSDTTDKISTLIYMAPFVSLIFIHFILGEHIYLTTLVGLVFIVSGILYQKSKV
jgi:drug/metabolite transporter (DMT)-like permease